MRGWDEKEYAPSQDAIDDLLESEEKDSAASTLAEAVKRIEEANLWKTLLLSSVFQSGSARPEIVQSVNAQIQQFAKERLEVCVGIKQNSSDTAQAPLPFSQEEISALKILAAKLLHKDPMAVLNRQYNPTIAQVSAPASQPASITVNPPVVQNSSAPQNLNKTEQKKSAVKKREKKEKLPGYIEQPQEYVPTNLNMAPIVSSNVEGAGQISASLESLVNKHIT